MTTEFVKLSKVKLNRQNPRTITDQKFESLINSILILPKMLNIRPIVVDNGYVALGGNMRCRALSAISKMDLAVLKKRISTIRGFDNKTDQEKESLLSYWVEWKNKPTVSIIKADSLSESEQREFIIKDNSGFGDWDMDMLANEWDADDLRDWGIDIQFDIKEEIIDEVVEDDFSEEDAQNVEERCHHLDIWELGNHRLMCGDSTDAGSIKRLVGDVEIDLYLTDPPYNVSYEGATSDKLTIMNDSMSDGQFSNFLSDAFKAADSVLKKGGAFYIWHADSEGFNFRNGVKSAGWELKQCLIWNKNAMVMGRQDYQWKHEPCLYGWKPGAAHSWYSDRKQTTVIDFDKPNANREHPTMKPVGLFGYLIENSTKKGESVLDSFGGSGTSIVACEQLGRRCYTMELDPHYCDVIIARWEKLTGKSAKLISRCENMETSTN